MGSTARLILPRSEKAMPAGGTAPEIAPLPPAPSLPYEVERPWYRQRRAFRIIVLLLLLNIVAVTSITWGPITVRAWQEHRERAKRADAQAKAEAARAATVASAITARTAAVKAALAFQMPAGQVVYSEDPDEAMRLLFAPGGIGRYSAVSQSLRWPNVTPPPPPVTAGTTPELRAALQAFVPNPSDGTAFLHERKAPGGSSRIVWVSLRAVRQGSQVDSTAQLWMERELRAYVLDSAVPTGGGYVSELWSAQVQIEQAGSRRLRIPFPAGDTATLPPAHGGEEFRLLTGRPDPDNPARLLIDYTLDGKPGTITMTLQADDRLRLDVDRGTTSIERFDARNGRVVWRP